MASGWPWLRLYSEVRTDAKVKSLPVAQRWTFVSLLCFAGEQPLRGTIRSWDPYLLAIECADGDEALLHATLETLQRLRIIEMIQEGPDQGAIRFVNWEKRQYDKPSDRPEAAAERKRRGRANQAMHAATIPPVHVRSREVTPCPAGDGDGDPEGESKSEKRAAHAKRASDYPPEFARFWEAVLRREPSKSKAFESWQKAQKRTGATPEEIHAGLLRWLPVFRATAAEDPSKIPHITTWLNEDRWTVEHPAVPTRASPIGTRPVGQVGMLGYLAQKGTAEVNANGHSQDRGTEVPFRERRQP